MIALEAWPVTLKDGRAATLRVAIPDDAEAMLRYMHASLPENQPYVLTTPEEFDYTPEQERQVIRETHERGGMFMLALAGDEVIGMLSTHPQRRRRVAHVAEMGMTVRQTFRDVGLGSAMMERLIAWAEAHPVLEMLQLSVYADNVRAIALYRKFGFVEAGRVPRRMKFGPGEYKDDVIMYRWINKVGSPAR